MCLGMNKKSQALRLSLYNVWTKSLNNETKRDETLLINWITLEPAQI